MDAMSDAELIDALTAGSFIDPSVMAYLKTHRPSALMDHLLDQMNDPNITVAEPARRWMRRNAHRS